MRIAVLADIHGNLPALEAVLNEIERLGVDLIVLNGDLADGPFPRETLERLQQLGDKAISLRGNGDRWLREACEGQFKPRGTGTDDLVYWAAAQITGQQRDFLKTLTLKHVIEHPLLGRLGFCHATARSDNEMFPVDATIEHARQAFANLDAEVVFLGHTHMPFDRLFDRRRFINSGSVGMPYGHTGASWALIDQDIALRRTAYDLDAASARIARSQMPDVNDFIKNYILTTYSDGEALDAFRPVMLKQQDTNQFD